MLNSPPLSVSSAGSPLGTVFAQHLVLAASPSAPRMMPVNHRRGPWLKSEDDCLKQLVQQQGAHSWVRISQKIGSRSPKQCRERYHQNLKPTLRHDPISQEEGESIMRLVSEIGPKWAEIARHLPGRSDNAVKNWYNGSQHRRKRGPSREHHSHPPHGQEMAHPGHGYYPYPQVHHQMHAAQDYAHDYPPSPQPTLAPLRNIDTSSRHSPATFNLPPISSSQAPKAPVRGPPEPRRHPFQPVPLPMPHGYSTKSHGYETPLPSPSYAPSLVTDNGSETRSPHGALSPLEVARQHPAPYHDDRRPSASESRYLPHHEDLRRRSSVQLAPLNVTKPMAPTRDLQYQSAAPQIHSYAAPASQHMQPRPHAERPAPAVHSHSDAIHPYSSFDIRRSSAPSPPLAPSRASIMRIGAIM